MAQSDQEATYPPVDVLKPVAEAVWIVDSGPMHVAGLALPVRMTVVRLNDGSLWLHSPTRFTAGLGRELDALGPVTHLVAPDVAHWSYLQEWQGRYTDAVTWAAPGLRDRAQVRKSGVRLDRDLSDAAPPEWAGEIDQVVVPGLGFSEVDFFHRPTRTLVMTDLIQSLEPERLPAGTRLFARLSGVLAPNARAPLYLRLVVRARRSQAVAAVNRMIEWRPERVIFSHGRWFDRDGAAALRRSFDWLLPRA